MIYCLVMRRILTENIEISLKKFICCGAIELQPNFKPVAFKKMFLHD